MTNKINTVDRDGRLVHIYDNGMERDAGTGQMVKTPAGVPFTSETAKLARRKRQEKTARLLRDAIRAETMDKLDVPHTGTAAAVAAAGGILWREIVLDPNAYPRDRMEAWEKLGKYAQVLVDPKQQQHEQAAQAPATGASAVLLALAELTKRGLSPDVIDAQAQDVNE